MATKLPTKPKAKTVDDFRGAHDRTVIVPRKIRAALATMLAQGRETWEYEGDVIKLAGIASGEVTAYREQFRAHIVVTPPANGKSARNVWFADVKVAAKVRKTLPPILAG